MPKPVAVSYHAAVAIGSNEILVFGGYKEDKSVSSSMHRLDLNVKGAISTNFKNEFATAGHSMVSLCDDAFVIVGGVPKQYSVYTKKALIPTACDLEDLCTIMESEETSPVKWIKCEGKCKRWLHQFCSGVANVPKGKWFCSQCKKKPRNRRK